MSSDTALGCVGPSHAPAVFRSAPLVASPAEPALTTRAISSTECSVHWVLLGESGLLSTSVPLHLQTTIGHQEAPRWPQYYPKGIVGNLAHRNKWGVLQKHGQWDEHLGHSAQVMSGVFKSGQLYLYCPILHKVFSVSFFQPAGCHQTIKKSYEVIVLYSGLMSQEGDGFDTSKYQTM